MVTVAWGWRPTVEVVDEELVCGLPRVMGGCTGSVPQAPSALRVRIFLSLTWVNKKRLYFYYLMANYLSNKLEDVEKDLYERHRREPIRK